VAKEELAYQATLLCHGEEAAEQARAAARALFQPVTKTVSVGMDVVVESALPVVEVSRMELEAGLPAFELFRRAGLATSNGEARRLIKGGGAKLNNSTVAEETRAVTHADLDAGGILKLSAGKKRHAIVRAV
jgi:tyrosyl-tRNA synthetase